MAKRSKKNHLAVNSDVEDEYKNQQLKINMKNKSSKLKKSKSI